MFLFLLLYSFPFKKCKAKQKQQLFDENDHMHYDCVWRTQNYNTILLRICFVKRVRTLVHKLIQSMLVVRSRSAKKKQKKNEKLRGV